MLSDAVMKLQWRIEHLEKVVAEQDDIIRQLAFIALCMGTYPPWGNTVEKTEEAK